MTIINDGRSAMLSPSAYRAVPCYIDGTFRVLPKGAVVPRSGRVRVSIGEPRSYHHVGNNDPGILSICSDLRRAVLALAPQPQPETMRQVSKEAYL